MLVTTAKVGKIIHTITRGDIRIRAPFISGCGIVLQEIDVVTPDDSDLNITCRNCRYNLGEAIDYNKG